jgi:hypothetical protein
VAAATGCGIRSRNAQVISRRAPGGRVASWRGRGLTNAPGPGPAHSLPTAVAGVVLAGYAIVMLLAASRTTIRRDVA